MHWELKLLVGLVRKLDDTEQRLLFGLFQKNGFKIDSLSLFSPIIVKKTTVDPIKRFIAVTNNFYKNILF